MKDLSLLGKQLGTINPVVQSGRITEIKGGLLSVRGLNHLAKLGDVLRVCSADRVLDAEVISLTETGLTALPETAPTGLSIGDIAEHRGPRMISPDSSWLGRVVDPWGRPLDGRPLVDGECAVPLDQQPPPAAQRRPMGARLGTGLAAFDTILPLVQGQRIGIFAGSGVGKTHLMGQLARSVDSDVRVIALIGERGREVSAFVRDVLGAEGLRNSIVIAATSDQSPLLRMACLPAALCVAEYFRDRGQHVLLLADSMTRFAEAYRETAISGGETPALRGFPPSLTPALMKLAERTGPGTGSQGDITAVLTVLVAGSNMEEPIADLVRGTLDGHVVLDRKIAERGRYPAINILKSVSRSLPSAATGPENRLISEARALLSSYEQAEPMVRAGLHQAGADPALDRAIALFDGIDRFVAEPSPNGPSAAFRRLAEVLSGGRR